MGMEKYNLVACAGQMIVDLPSGNLEGHSEQYLLDQGVQYLHSLAAGHWLVRSLPLRV